MSFVLYIMDLILKLISFRATSSAEKAAAARGGKVRSLSARLKIPTGAAARIIEPGTVEYLEMQRGAAYAATGAGASAGAVNHLHFQPRLFQGDL